MSILDCIGNTPLVELRKIHPKPGVRLMAKLEGTNPGGSVKVRIAFSMIHTMHPCVFPDLVDASMTEIRAGSNMALPCFG